ncbi:MAG: hypothetical protein J0M15_04965 [Deltaproteobacteria bacterium]|nr:hypothetical protein [Deltaproteobacteria bacterium]
MNRVPLIEFHSKQIVVFGQRGVGKTSFRDRLKNYWKDSSFVFLDLDQEIESHLGKTISSIIEIEGEATFRKYELDVFKKIILQHPQFVLTLGGGFPVKEIPPHLHKIWIQRPADEYGRIFFDRPRLDPEVSDLAEFFQRAQLRAAAFEIHHDEIYLMPEGIRTENDTEKSLFKIPIEFNMQNSSYLTLTKELNRMWAYLYKVQESGFEFRDDLLPFEEFKLFYMTISPKHFILSFRDKIKIIESEKNFINFKNSIALTSQAISMDLDWALELGSPLNLNKLKPTIISLHDYLPQENLTQFLERLSVFSGKETHLKASPMIESFSDLQQLWEWQQNDPTNRSILPRSKTGRWTWFRQWMKGRQKINFWKSSTKGTALDQPSLYQWLSQISTCKHFAAVLGSPVNLSRTPLEQENFFSKYHFPVLAIDMSEDEFDRAMVFLIQLGLIAAAVTSPLKRKAYSLVANHVYDKSHPLTHKDLASLNTLFIFPEKNLLEGINTDLEGFAALASAVTTHESSQNLKVLIWGGGGTLPVIKKTFPQAIEYSIREGAPRNQTKDANENPGNPHIDIDVLIWAGGPQATMPNLNMSPKYIIDLNYREDSLARAYAKSHKAIYLSGEKMFLVQAEKQRHFWSLLLTEVGLSN